MNMQINNNVGSDTAASLTPTRDLEARAKQHAATRPKDTFGGSTQNAVRQAVGLFSTVGGAAIMVGAFACPPLLLALPLAVLGAEQAASSDAAALRHAQLAKFGTYAVNEAILQNPVLTGVDVGIFAKLAEMGALRHHKTVYNQHGDDPGDKPFYSVNPVANIREKVAALPGLSPAQTTMLTAELQGIVEYAPVGEAWLDAKKELQVALAKRDNVAFLKCATVVDQFEEAWKTGVSGNRVAAAVAIEQLPAQYGFQASLAPQRALQHLRSELEEAVKASDPFKARTLRAQIATIEETQKTDEADEDLISFDD